jgi:hypothetical protein
VIKHSREWPPACPYDRSWSSPSFEPWRHRELTRGRCRRGGWVSARTAYKWLARWQAASGCFTTAARRTGEATAGGDAADLRHKEPGDHQAAAELVEIIKRDQAWNDDGARKQLLQFFDSWGAVEPATVAARRKLSALLFS